MSEAELMRQIQIALSATGSRFFRNNVGTGWVGKSSKINTTDMLIHNARPLHAGLCEGSSDLIGWRPTLITPDMVGLTLAIFAATEVKSPQGRLSKHQENFINAVNSAGGIAVCARSVSQAVGAFSDNQFIINRLRDTRT